MSLFRKIMTSLGPKGPNTPHVSAFLAGQVWSYRTRAGEEQSTLLVLGVEQSNAAEAIVHIRIRNVALPHPSGGVSISEIGHMPFPEGVLRRAVIDVLSVESQIPDHSEALRLWHEGGGGLWGVPPSEAIEAMEATLRSPDRSGAV